MDAPVTVEEPFLETDAPVAIEEPLQEMEAPVNTEEPFEEMDAPATIEESYEVPLLPPRPPDDDPNADFIVKCLWNDDQTLQELHLRRRAKGEKLVTRPEVKDNSSYQLLKGWEISQKRYPNGIIWRVKTRLKSEDETSHRTRSGMYRLYITWDMNKQLQEAQITRYQSKNRIVPNPIKKRTYILMDLFKSNYEFYRDGRGFLRQMTLLLGPKSGRFGPANAPSHMIRYKNLIFRWGPNGEVTSTIVTNVEGDSSGTEPHEVESAPEPMHDCNIVVLEPPPTFDPNDADYGIPNHRKLIERRQFKKRRTTEHPNPRKLCTYPIRGAPLWIQVDDGDFFLDFEDESGAPISEKNMWPYLKSKYENEECMQRKILYDKGQREYGDYDAFVFDEEYLKELIKIAETNIALLTERLNPNKKPAPNQNKTPLDRVRNCYYLE